MRRSPHLALAFIAACTSAVALYALLRVAQAMLFEEPDPALIIWSEHAGYYWRALTVSYAGGMIGFVVLILARRDLARTARAVSLSVVVAAIMIAAQGLLVP